MDFPAEINYLPKMISFVHQQAHTAGLPKEKIHKLELASEEALVNVISYAYSLEEREKKVSVECHQEGNETFKVIIRDGGKPFNPLLAPPNADMDKPVDERKVGGLGIFLLRRLMDDVNYERVDSQNVLTLSIRNG